MTLQSTKNRKTNVQLFFQRKNSFYFLLKKGLIFDRQKIPKKVFYYLNKHKVSNAVKEIFFISLFEKLRHFKELVYVEDNEVKEAEVIIVIRHAKAVYVNEMKSIANIL